MEALSQLYNKGTADDSVYVGTFRIKKTSTTVVYQRVGIYFDGTGVSNYAFYNFNPTTGVLFNSVTTADNISTTVELVGGYWWVYIAASDSDACDNVRWYLNPAHNTTGLGSNDNAAQGSTVVDWAQLENASTATSPIYTTSTAVTRPADSASYTMSDEFKNKFAEALGSELAPDFGVVLGDELITAQNDRDFNTDEGNWTVFTDGTSTIAHNTDSIGGHDDTQIKVSSAAGDDYALARIQSPTHTETIDQDSYYFFSADVYLDPNSDQDTISIYPSNFSTSNYVINSSGLAGKDVTPNKGVWERVWNIFELADDVAGNYFIGFFDIGNLTTNDIVYVDNISLRKITFSDDWTAGDGWGPKFALTAPSLGDEELSNGDFQ
jgi:hypothetical protein